MRKILHYLICCCTLSILFFSANTVTAQTLEITPSAFYIEGNYGDLILKDVQFVNTAPVNLTVNITTDLDNLFIASSALYIPAFGTKNLPIGFLILEEQVGWITYDIGGSTYNQLVFIEVNKSEADIYIFPSEPTAGDIVVFLDMSDDKYDAMGVVYISSSAKSYLLNMEDGMGSINLTNEDYGNAFVKINSGGKSTYKEFTIKQSSNSGTTNNDDSNSVTATPKILCPNDVKYGEIKDVTVELGNKTGVNTRILITRPNGFSYEGITNSFGRLSIEFNEVGEWQFTALVGDKTTSGSTIVNKITETLVLKSDEATSENNVIVEVFDDAYVTVTGPDFNDEGAEHGGQYVFIPKCPGVYTVEAESSSKKGEITVTVNCQPTIIVIDADSGRNVVGAATAEQSYYIKLLDYNHDTISVNDDLKIYDASDPYSEPLKIPMVDETAYWTPIDEGNYRIEFAGDGFYTSAQALLSTKSAASTIFVPDIMTIGILLIVFIVIISYLYMSGRLSVIAESIKQKKELKKRGKKISKYEDVSSKVDNVIPH